MQCYSTVIRMIEISLELFSMLRAYGEWRVCNVKIVAVVCACRSGISDRMRWRKCYINGGDNDS